MNNGSQDEELDITNLVENQAWEDTKKTYYTNKVEFDILASNLSRKYKVDLKVSRDSIIYEIMSCQYGSNKHIFDGSIVKWCFIYVFSLLFVFISGLVSLLKSLFTRKVNRDVLYEEMWPKNSLYNRFYTYIDTRLSKDEIKRSVLLVSPGIGFFKRKIQGWEGEVINKRYASMIFDFKLSINVIFNDFIFIIKLYNLSKESKVNFIYVYLRVIRKLLMYHSQSCDVKANVLISASDYYWSPLKYHMYKQNIKNIVLLQHNYINDYLHLRLFQYCDYYYAHSQQAIDKHSLCGSAEFFNVGSFQLIPFIDQNELEYDIVFISQTVYQNLISNWKELDQTKLQRSYNTLIDNFHVYIKDNPNLKAVYISKIGHENMQPTLRDKHLFDGLNNVKFTTTGGKDTFDIISKSRVVINMYSSVGFESYGLDKRVLWVNYNGCCDVFKYDTECEDIHTMISDTSYSAFKNKMELLLSDSEKVDNHYKGLKEKYMNIQENPAELVAMKVKQLLINDL